MRRFILLAAFTLPFAACTSDEKKEELPPSGLAGASAGEAAPQPAAAPSAAPAAASQPAAAASPHGQMGTAPPPEAGAASQPAAPTVVKGQGSGETAELQGTVIEVHHVKEYSYMRVKSVGGSESWAAVLKDESIAVGTKVRVQKDLWMSDFDSPSLGRKFDRILFGRIASKG